MKIIWLAGAAGIALITPGLAAPAMAQTEAASVEEIVVSGTRLQNQRSIAQKRLSDVTSDYLEADEINRQPDFNIADAFRRIPGVFTIFDEDEGRYVGIRGLNGNFTVATLDNAGIASSERGNRQVNLEAVPSSAVKRLNVIKSRTAAEEGNAIGGTINLVTRSAFDRPGFFAAGSASIGYTDSQDVPGRGYGRSGDNGPSYRFEGTTSTRFADDKIGVVLSGSYLQRRRDQQRTQPTSYGVGIDGLATPNGFLYGGYPNTIERFGGLGKIEFRPTDALEASLMVSRFTQEDTELRLFQQLTRQGTITKTGADTGRYSAGAAFVRFNDFFIDKPLFTAQGKMAWRPGAAHRFDATVSHSKATFHEPSNEIQFDTAGNQAALAGDYVVRDGQPFLTLADPAYFQNPANYRFTSYDFYDQVNDDIVDEYEVNYGYNSAAGDLGLGFDTGAQLRTTERTFDEQRLRVRPGATNTLTLAGLSNGAGYVAPGAPTPLLVLDADAFLSHFNANRQNFTITQSNTAADYSFEEEVLAAYGQAVWRGQRYALIAGLRYERTETSVERPRGGVMVTRDNSYDDLLPSVTGYYDITDRVKVRAAYYKALGRPNPLDLAGAEVVSTGSDGAPQLTRGNPDLTARQADNFDLSVEYYFPGDQGLVSFAVFNKDISDEIFSFTDMEVIDGVSTRVTQARNVSSARVRGFEASLVQNRLTFLPGALADFGYTANFTYIDGEVDVTGPGGATLRKSRLLQQPETIMNASLFYKRGPFEGRATYARSSRFLTSLATSASDVQDREDAPYQQIDLSARYDLSTTLQLTAEARNVGNTRRRNNQTAAEGDLLRDYNIYGRTFFVGVAFRF